MILFAKSRVPLDMNRSVLIITVSIPSIARGRCWLGDNYCVLPCIKLFLTNFCDVFFSCFEQKLRNSQTIHALQWRKKKKNALTWFTVIQGRRRAWQRFHFKLFHFWRFWQTFLRWLFHKLFRILKEIWNWNRLCWMTNSNF